MPNEPQIKVLSEQRRERFFWVLVVVFLVTLPTLIFYTTGYRLSFEDEQTTIVSTGGMYINTEDLDVEVYLDEELIERPRLFRSAYYIQNLSAGQHRVVVQRPDLQTWVKDLPVYSHIVTEASAFNLPERPHVRPITPYLTAAGTPVLFGVASGTEPFGIATSTEPVFVATTTATSSFTQNEEFVFVSSLFSITSTSTRSVFERLVDGLDRFRFATTTDATSTATSTQQPVARGNTGLFIRNGELFAEWIGNQQNIPYYYCVSTDTATSTAARYGDHVAEAFSRIREATSTEIIIDGNRRCRPEIKLDRLRQDVFYYAFFPNTQDLVVLHLEDGVYVTEIDDRAWQNTQLLYPGTDLTVVVENDLIFVRDGERYYELITEIEPSP